MSVYINNRRFTSCQEGQEKNMCIPNLFRNSVTGLATSNYIPNPPVNKRLYARVFDQSNTEFTMCPDNYLNCNNPDNKNKCTLTVGGNPVDTDGLCIKNIDNPTKENLCKPLTTLNSVDTSIKDCVYNNDDNILLSSNLAPKPDKYIDPQKCLNDCENIVDDNAFNYNIGSCSKSKSKKKSKKNCMGVSVKIDDNSNTNCQYLNDMPKSDSLSSSTMSKLYLRSSNPYAPPKPSYTKSYSNLDDKISNPYLNPESQSTDSNVEKFTNNDIIDCPDDYNLDVTDNVCFKTIDGKQVQCRPKDYYDTMLIESGTFNVLATRSDTNVEKGNKPLPTYEDKNVLASSCSELGNIVLGKDKGQYLIDACENGASNAQIGGSDDFCAKYYKNTACTKNGKAKDCSDTKGVKLLNSSNKNYAKTACDFGTSLYTEKNKYPICEDNGKYMGSEILPNMAVEKDGVLRSYLNCSDYTDIIASNNDQPSLEKLDKKDKIDKKDLLKSCLSGYNNTSKCNKKNFSNENNLKACKVGQNIKKKENNLVNKCIGNEKCNTFVNKVHKSNTPRYNRRIYKYYTYTPSKNNGSYPVNQILQNVDYPSEIVSKKLDFTGQQNYVDLGVTKESIQRMNNNPTVSTTFDLYNVSPFGAGPDGRRKLHSDDNPIFNNPKFPGSSSNVIEMNPNVGPSFTGPFNRGHIDDKSGTALMDYLNKETFINKCGDFFYDNSRGFVTLSIIILLVSIILYKKYVN